MWQRELALYPRKCPASGMTKNTNTNSTVCTPRTMISNIHASRPWFFASVTSIGGNISPRPDQQSRRRYRLWSLTCARGRGTTSWQSPRGWASANGHANIICERRIHAKVGCASTTKPRPTPSKLNTEATRRAQRRLSRPKRVYHGRDGNQEHNLEDRDGHVHFHAEETRGKNFLAA
jgi:hypothetical protein